MNDVISLSDIANWVSKKFEADPASPMLTIQIDSKRRMMQLTTATNDPQDQHTQYAYVVEGRDPVTFMPDQFFDIIFLDAPCPSFERLMALTEDSNAKRMTIARLTMIYRVMRIEDQVATSIWEHLTVQPLQPA